MLLHVLPLVGAVALSALVVAYPGRTALTADHRAELGIAYMKLGLDGTERELRAALAEAPGHPRASLALGMWLTSQKRHDEAVAALEAARAAAGYNDLEPSLALAVAEHTRGRTDAARALLEALRTRFPEDGRPAFNLALLALKRGDKAEARLRLQEALGKGQLARPQRRDGQETLRALTDELAAKGRLRETK
jgi:Flp pilus assembly protein TadD